MPPSLSARTVGSSCSMQPKSRNTSAWQTFLPCDVHFPLWLPQPPTGQDLNLISFPFLFPSCLSPPLRPFGHGVSHSAFETKCLAELDQVCSALRTGCISEHSVSSTLVFGYYQCRQDAWLLGLASYEKLGLTTPVIGTGACVDGKRPIVAKLQFLVLLPFFLIHVTFSLLSSHIFLGSLFSARWLFRQSTKHAGFTALLRRLQATWTIHDAEFSLCEVRKWRSRAKLCPFQAKKLAAKDARLLKRVLALQTFLG